MHQRSTRHGLILDGHRNSEAPTRIAINIAKLPELVQRR